MLLPCWPPPSCGPVTAQILYGSVVGVVKDPQGGCSRRDGHDRQSGHQPHAGGRHGRAGHLHVHQRAGRHLRRQGLAAGFPRDTSDPACRSASARSSRVDVTLEVGTVSETVTVASEAQLLQTDKADVSTELKSTELTSLPLNRFRNYQALINLVPGTTPMAFGNAETDTPARSLATNVNGQANTNNSTRTDGATNMNIWLPNHIMYISPAETIDTVNISTSSFDAEQGMAGGAAVTVVTKSGTNKFKGSAFEFFNSDKLNAKPRFFGAGAAPGKLPVKANTYGGTLGGPITKNQLFFFGSFEGYKREQSLFTFFNVPDDALRRGRFQPGAQHQRHAADHLRPGHGQRRRHRPHAVREQPDSGEPDRSDRAEDHAALPAAEHAGHRRRRPDATTTGARKTAGRPRQLRREAELEPHRGAPDLGQVQLHERRRRRPDQLPRAGSERRR